MIIKEPDPKVRILDDLDFTFENGQLHPVTLDKASGDSVDYDTHKDAIIINLVERASESSPDEYHPAETLTIFKNKILFISHRTREVTERTKAEQTEWMKTLQEVGGTIN